MVCFKYIGFKGERRLVVGLSLGLSILFFCLLLFCTFGLILYCKTQCSVQQLAVQPHNTEATFSAERTAERTAVVLPYQMRSFITPTSVATSYSTQQPATVNDATVSNQEAPPSYAVATDFPSVQQVLGIIIPHYNMHKDQCTGWPPTSIQSNCC